MSKVCSNCGEPIYHISGKPCDLSKVLREEAEEQIYGDLYEDDINSDYPLTITLTVQEVRRLVEKVDKIAELEVEIENYKSDRYKRYHLEDELKAELAHKDKVIDVLAEQVSEDSPCCTIEEAKEWAEAKVKEAE